jgi:hypothetical protein
MNNKTYPMHSNLNEALVAAIKDAEETERLINQLAVAVDFTMRLERYAEEIGDKFLADKARETLLKIKGGT